MSRSFHRLVLYGVGSFTCLALGFAAERRAAAAPIVARPNARASPERSDEIGPQAEGGSGQHSDPLCNVTRRVLIHSDQPIEALRAHYARKGMRSPRGTEKVFRRVLPASETKDLAPIWQRHRNDPKAYVVEFVSPGSSGTDAGCGVGSQVKGS